MSDPAEETGADNVEDVKKILAAEKAAFALAAARFADFLAPLGLDVSIGIVPKERQA